VSRAAGDLQRRPDEATYLQRGSVVISVFGFADGLAGIGGAPFFVRTELKSKRSGQPEGCPYEFQIENQMQRPGNS
jgi:hypothetical protein